MTIFRMLAKWFLYAMTIFTMITVFSVSFDYIVLHKSTQAILLFLTIPLWLYGVNELDKLEKLEKEEYFGDLSRRPTGNCRKR